MAADTVESDRQPAVNIGLFDAWRPAQDRCRWRRKFVKTATDQRLPSRPQSVTAR